MTAGGAFRCSGHVEVAQRGIAQAVNAVEPGEHLLDEELGFAIGVGGEKTRILMNRNGFRLSIDGGGGGKDQPPGTMGQHSFKQGQGCGGVVAEEDFGADHGLAGFNERGEVENAVERVSQVAGLDEKVFKSEPVRHFTLDKVDAGWKQVTPAVAKVVKNQGLMSFFGKQASDGTADVSRASGD